MEERVCRALAKSNKVDPDRWGHVTFTRGNVTVVSTDNVPAWFLFIDDVRAMFAAMGTPTQAMVDAVMTEFNVGPQQYAWHKNRMMKMWATLIQAATNQ